MKTKTVDVSVASTIGGTLTLQLPADIPLDVMKKLIELRLENEGINEDTKGFKLKHREYDVIILAVTDGES